MPTNLRRSARTSSQSLYNVDKDNSLVQNDDSIIVNFQTVADDNESLGR